MKFIDAIFSDCLLNTLSEEPNVNDEKEAFLTIVVASACADKDIEGEEWDSIYDTLFQKKIFSEVDDLNELLKQSIHNVKTYTSLTQAISECAKFIKPENKNTLFAVCVEMVFIKGNITKKEQSLIEHLKNELNVYEELAKKIIEVMMVKNYGNR